MGGETSRIFIFEFWQNNISIIYCYIILLLARHHTIKCKNSFFAFISFHIFIPPTHTKKKKKKQAIQNAQCAWATTFIFKLMRLPIGHLLETHWNLWNFTETSKEFQGKHLVSLKFSPFELINYHSIISSFQEIVLFCFMHISQPSVSIIFSRHSRV